MSLLPVGFGASGDDYEITDSLRLRSSASAYLSWTPGSNGNRQIFTFSAWVKRGALGAENVIFHAGTASTNRGHLRFNSDDTCEWAYYNGSWILWLKTTAVFRDPSAWYHIVGRCNTTNGTSNLYINGVDQTSLSQNSKPSGSQSTSFGQTVEHQLGQRGFGDAGYLDGYQTEVNFIDGQALDPTDFGEFDANGTWKAKEYTGTYGTNGFYLPMKPTTQAELQNTVIYSGNGSTQSIDGVGYAPDLVWLKGRTLGYNHRLYDTVRGSGASLIPDSTTAEGFLSGLDSFQPDGFTLGTSIGTNNTSNNYVAWTWDAGDNQPSTGISSVTYYGTGTERQVTGFGFSPDLVWLKGRSVAYAHGLYDVVRGVTKKLSSNLTNAEVTDVNGLTSFGSDGFTLGSDAGTNQSGQTYVAWGWDAGDGDPVSNTTGDINSTVKASDATGFSIVSYTGTGANATVGHGLSTAPSVIIVKERTSTSGWVVYTSMTGAGQYLSLHSTAAASSSTTTWNNTTPTSSVFSLSTSGANNQSSQDYIAYCFSEVSGVSKFDSYTGTNSTGNSVTTGFRPGFVMIKRSDGSAAWNIIDSTRSPFSTTGNGQFQDRLFPDQSSAESTNADVIEFTDTGFVINAVSSSQFNNSGATYIYMAFKGSYSDHVSPLNDTGTIDSRVKANPDKGFSIVSWEGNGSNSTIGHGLTSAPEFFFLKNRDTSVNDWIVYDSTIGATKFLRLNQTNATTTQSNIFNDTAPTNSVLSVGTNSAVNSNGVNYIAYCFHSVAGYSDFGSYTGTGSSGNSVTGLGFRPAWLMIKRTDSADEWAIHDSVRDVDGNQNTRLRADNAGAELTSQSIVFTDTGFTVDSTSSSHNASGGTYIYMAFADTADARFNFDASGNKNNFDANNINSSGESETTYDLMKDTPSLVDENAANFAVLNPLNDPRTYVTYSNANLTAINTSAALHSPFISTIGMAPNSGKYYWEVIGTGDANTRNAMGIGTAASMSTTTVWGFVSGQAGLFIGGSASVYFYDESGTSTFNVAWASGNVVMHCYDANTGKFWIGQNGVWYNSSGGTTGDPATGANPTATLDNTDTWFPGGTVFNQGANSYLYYNFGQRPFAYTPPTGFLKLNTFNLPDSTIEDGSDYFNTVLYTGDGATNHNITGVGFQPEFVWLKERSSTSFHQVLDSVRGAGIRLETNSTGAETTPSPVGLSSFDSDGFTVQNNNGYNQSGQTYVAWNWLANGSGVSNTDGDIPSTVSANTEAGFSIVGFTAPSGTGNFTAGHGLGVTPAMVIVKTRDSSAAPWYTWHNTFSNLTDDYMRLNATSAKQTQSSGWGAGMTSSVIGLRAGYTTVATEDHIAYCFAEVEGYSAFGSYTGNGSTDGPFVYTGFRPAFVVIKETTSTGSWVMLDTTRSTYNVINNDSLWANLSSAEGGSASYFDMLSNGFKIRDTDSDKNSSGQTYIYMAFAENPFKNANAR